MTTHKHGKAIINNEAAGLHIVISSRKIWFFLIFTCIWLSAWFVALFHISDVLNWKIGGDRELDTFMFIWTGLWLCLGVTAFLLLLWGLFGKEELFIPKGKREILFKKHIFGLGIKRRLEKSQIKNFRFNGVPDQLFTMRKGWAVWGAGPGKIKFDYGLKTYSLGLGLDDAEANYIIYLLDEKLS